MEDKRNEVIKQLRSFCVSNKGQLSVRQLIRDYITIIGTKIPYKEFGYKTIEDFLNSEKTFRLVNKGSETYIVAEPTEKTAHIAEFVSRQKSSKKKPPKVRFRDTAPRYKRSSDTTSKWRASNSSSSNYAKKVHASSRLKTVNHAQFINKSSRMNEAASSSPINTYNEQLPKKKKEDSNYRLITNNNNNNYSNYDFTADISFDNITQISKTKRPARSSNDDQSISAIKSVTHDTSLIKIQSDKDAATEFSQTDDSLKDLKRFSAIHNLGEVTINITKLKARKSFYSCRIKIGDKHTFSSYPKEFNNPLEAQRYCCTEALKDLIPKYKRKSLTISTDKNILKRIPPMLEKHYHGIWSWQLKLDYADKYNEILPDNWLEIIDTSTHVQVEKSIDNYILYYCTPENALQKGRARSDSFPMLPDVSVPANTVQLNEDGRVICQINCVMSINEIWCQQIGTEESDLYAEMYERLQVYYQNNEKELVAENVALAGYYIAKYDDSYHRIRALGVKENNVNCFFIDWGGETNVPKTDIFNLKREYATIQAQVFVCRLYGLEDLDDIPYDSPTLAGLQDLHVILELPSQVCETNSSYDALPVYMCDLDNGQSINQLLIHKLPIELASSNLPKGSIAEAFTTNVTADGDVYIQIRTHGYEYFSNLKKEVENELELNPRKEILYEITKENSRDKLYLMKTETDNTWHRVKFIDWSPYDNDKAQIYFVDQGHADVITVSEHILYPLEKLNDILSIYPDQAIRLRMTLDHVPSNFVELAEKVLPKDQSVLVKIIDIINDLHLVEIFRRNTDGGLFSVNRSISFEAELRKQIGEGSNKNKFKLTMSPKSPNHHRQVPSTGSLERPQLPKIDQYFQVSVPFAVNPSNFFVQPLSTRKILDELMEKLQKCYRNVQYGNLKIDDICPGNIYASKQEDGFWYRTSVIKVIHSDSVSVYYCDFGFYLTVPVKQLLPLAEEFMELPYQAFKAKLAGIKPVQSKWTVEDCKKFKQMIEGKSFYAKLKNIENDVLYESDLVLKLTLINTSGADDIYIDNLLVENGIALKDNADE